MSQQPSRLNGMRHIAFAMPNLEECEHFYTQVLGMQVLNRASEHLVYLTCGNDNLSLSRCRERSSGHQTLDHFGFIVDTKAQLQAWYDYLQASGAELLDRPHDHSDGARSFHVADPAGNTVQLIYHPAISGQVFTQPD